MVSVICNAYNHQEYIEEAIKSFVRQKTTFEYEILIHDDASTDNTKSIIMKYAQRYPNLIYPVFEKENQYSKGVCITSLSYPRVRGKYIAFCEGDDYWCDDQKLQKQFDILEKNPNIDMCAHKSLIFNMKKPDKKKYVSPRKKNSILSFRNVVKGGGAYLATSSLFFRKSLIENEPSFRRNMPIDYTLQIMGSLSGGIYYLSDCMSVYRFLSPGSWTINMKRNYSKRIEHEKRIQSMFMDLDKDTDFKYTRFLKAVRSQIHLSFKIKSLLIGIFYGKSTKH